MHIAGIAQKYSRLHNKNMEKQKRILIIDDDPLISRMYEHHLTSQGFEVAVSFNGEEAITAIRKNRPDLIFLDVMMPKLNGVETLKILKSEEKTKRIPVIFLTNLSDNEDDIKKARELGALDYLVKSEISLKALAERAKKALEMKMSS